MSTRVNRLNHRAKVAEGFHLPERTRKSLLALFQTQQSATREFQTAMTIAIDMLGLDPTLNHGVNFETGVITPAEESTPTLVPEELA